METTMTKAMAVSAVREICVRPWRGAMRNDARPIGEAFRDIAEHDRPDKHGPQADQPPPAEHAPQGGKTFVTGRDPGDEELPEDRSDR